LWDVLFSLPGKHAGRSPAQATFQASFAVRQAGLHRSKASYWLDRMWGRMASAADW